jgi:hypothetical protein
MSRRSFSCMSWAIFIIFWSSAMFFMIVPSMA